MQIKEDFDILVIGAGASGLSAAYELSSSKMKVIVLEAQHRIGGRMYTNLPQNFTSPIESGAEFIHGDAPITQALLKKAGISYHEVEGNTYQDHENNIAQENFFDNDWETVLDKLKSLHSDMTFADFLKTNFSDVRSTELRKKMTSFVEGYNAADINKVSCFFLREEWAQEDDAPQYRIDGGYATLYNFLRKEAEGNGVSFCLGEKVQLITWKPNSVEVETRTRKFTASKCIVTIPISLLSSKQIAFNPPLPEVTAAATNVGFGGVVKVNLEFARSFWETDPQRKMPSIQFLFSDERIPTWWSQSPRTRPLLTGWAGGPRASLLNQPVDVVFEIALQSLSNAMNYPVDKIRKELIAWHVDQWIDNEFSRGAYSYGMIGTSDALKILRQPVEDTLYFAGEAIYDGPFKSTVEAALTSGKTVAGNIVNKRK